MKRAYVVTGTLSDAQTVALDEPITLSSAKVRLVIEPLESAPARTYREVMAAIRADQAARGHRPPSRAEVDAWVVAERDAWG